MLGSDDENSSSRHPIAPNAKFIEAAALLSHVQMLESRLPPPEQDFGHPPPPELHMCRIPDPDRPGANLSVFATLAVTKRCASAQLLKESASFSAAGAPVEVLLMSEDEQITSATLVPLELALLSAEDTLIVPNRSSNGLSSLNNSDSDSDHSNSKPKPVVSLMSGGIVPVASSPRVAIVFGTSLNRVLSVEFSVKPKTMQLIRRNHFLGKELLPYYQPLPIDQLTEPQKRLQSKKIVASPRRKESTSSNTSSNNNEAKKKTLIQPFHPTGGVTHLIPSSMGKDITRTYLWISYGDGTAVRLHHAGLFPSVIQKHSESQPTQESLEKILGEESLVKCHLRLPELIDTTATVVPIFKYHPSPMAPFPNWKRPEFDDDNTVDTSPNAVQSPGQEDVMPEMYEAILYCTGYMADTFPTLAFYTSEDQFSGRIQGDDMEESKKKRFDDNILGVVLGGAGALLGGLVGGLMGGGASRARQEEDEKRNGEESNEGTSPAWDPQVPFPSINCRPLSLYAGYEFHDSPRQITLCTVDPEGDLAATADTLGRVSLIDLSTKQVIRMWKGFRDTSCYWLQVPQTNKEKPWQKSKVLYLVIHSRQRRVVEVWRTRHGPRVKTMQVGREAQVVSCRELSEVGYVSSCYLAHSTVPFSSMNQVENILVTEEEGAIAVKQKSRSTVKRPDAAGSTQLTQEAAVRLQRLQQLLGDTNVVCQSIDVYKALTNIKSVKDLATALDLLAVATALEEKMEVEGSTFQRLAVSHCHEKLEDAIKDAGREALTNPHVQKLAFKITYFSQVSILCSFRKVSNRRSRQLTHSSIYWVSLFHQIVSAFDILHQFEMGTSEATEEDQLAPKSSWVIEALGWTATHEQITRKSIDADIPQISTAPVKFYTFAKACVPPKDWQNWKDSKADKEEGYRVYLSDSSKTRRDILVHIFKPLLADIFAFKVVNRVFESLGLNNDDEYVLKVSSGAT
jgi:hypothetical protein